MKPVEEEGALWSFDAANGAWSMVKPAESAAPYPLGRSYHCITSDGEGKIFVHAGCPEAGRLSDLWEFDIARRAWRELASAPPPSRGGASIAYVDAKLYRINGFDGKTEQGGSVDVFDIGQGAWSSVQYQPDGKQGPECRSVSVLVPVCIGGKAHLVTAFGERDPSSLGHAGAGKMLSDTWAFSIEEGKWSKVQDAGQEKPEPRGWFDADAMDDDAIIIHGGLNEDNKRLGDVWELRFN
jgi:N-acetylneuraminic acid mutarotase